MYDTFLNRFLRDFEDFSLAQITEKELKLRITHTISDILDVYLKNEPYSEYAYTCWTNFEAFYIHNFETAQANILQTVYDEVKKIYEEIFNLPMT